MSEKKHILLVEDDLSFGAVLKSLLEISNYQVNWVDDGNKAINQFKSRKYHLCLLDVMLPHVDGFTIGREIRSMDPVIPILYLTARSQKQDIVTGFQSGADDYLVKPFDADLLLLKMAALLKRVSDSPRTESQIIPIGEYLFDPQLRTITRHDRVTQMSPKESALLFLLCEHINQLLPREVALKQIWQDDGYFTTRSMDVFVTRLRRYLKDDPSIEIKNIHGSGFMLRNVTFVAQSQEMDQPNS